MDVPPRTVPTTARSTGARSPGRTTRTRCRPTPRTGCRARPRPSCGALMLRMVASPEPVPPRPGSPTSTTGTSAATPCWPSPPTPASSGSTRRRSRGRRDGHRLQRPLHHARPVRRCAAGAGRGVPERGHHRRGAARRHRLPELRLARGPGRDVAVQRGRPRPRRRLRRSSASRSPAATSASTTRPARRRSCPPRWSACSACIDDVRPGASPIGFAHRRDADLLLGETGDEFDGSEWAYVVHGHLGGTPAAGRPGRASRRWPRS